MELRRFNITRFQLPPIIPIYLEIGDKGVWYPHFAIRYYRTFASQYISYLERDESLVSDILELEEIRDYGKKNSISRLVKDVESLWRNREIGMHDSMWETASWAPHRFASLYNQRIVIMIDEFQNISRYIYRDEPCQSNYDKTMPGSYHELAESKVAPMLVTGSYVGWLVNLIDEYLEGGRLEEWDFSPYLSPEEGLEAVYQYAEFYKKSISNATAVSINELCMADPYFISCVIQSQFPQKELRTRKGVIETVNYELSHRKARFAKTWAQYIDSAVDRINDRNAKNILLHLSKYSDRTWTHLELKRELNLDLDPKEILRKLVDLFKADLIEEGTSDIEFRGLQDGTLYLILKSRFGAEIKIFSGDVRDELSERHERLVEKMTSLQGKVNNLTGKMAEGMLAAEFRNKIYPDREVLAAFFSAGGFTSEAQAFCEKQEIGTSTQLFIDLSNL